MASEETSGLIIPKIGDRRYVTFQFESDYKDMPPLEPIRPDEQSFIGSFYHQLIRCFHLLNHPENKCQKGRPHNLDRVLPGCAQAADDDTCNVCKILNGFIRDFYSFVRRNRYEFLPCKHCGLPVLNNLVHDDRDDPKVKRLWKFCSENCRSSYDYTEQDRYRVLPEVPPLSQT